MRAFPLFAIVVFACSAVRGQRVPVLEILSKVPVQVAEPSDLCADVRTSGHYFIASDNGYVAEIDGMGRLLRRSGTLAMDLEACMMHDGQLVVVDETARRVIWLDTATFQLTRSLTVQYNGARNKGFESIAWNPATQRYLLITERDPVYIMELDADLRVLNEVRFDPSVRDVSSALFRDGFLWVLSDEDRSVMRCDPRSYAIIESWSLPIINPEGFAFGDDGTLHVVSDDRQMLYTFKLPQGS